MTMHSSQDPGSSEQGGSPSGSFVMVVHGAEIFDAGEAAALIDALRPARTIVAGVMARTAAEESELPVEYNGSPPSRIIRALTGPVALANHAKTSESGLVFGNIVASRLEGRGLIQIECADKTVTIWDSGDRCLAGWIADLTGYLLRFRPSTPDRETSERRIRGCLPGEAVYVNGIIVGQATGDTVVLRTRGSSVEAVQGLIPKNHGFEKLKNLHVTLATAWCKSGPIRHAAAAIPARHVQQSGLIAVIDHCGHEVYNVIGPDCCGVLAIGDDTTAVCGHICSHRGIAVLGIVDGDRDTFLPASFAPGSVVLECRGERDDDVGREIARMICGEHIIWNDWVAQVLDRLSDRVRIVVDMREVA